MGGRSTGNVHTPQPRNNPTTELSPELRRSLQEAKLAFIHPSELLEHCGTPTLDANGTVKTERFGVLPRRKMVYRAFDGSVFNFSFVSLDDGVSWVAPEITDGTGRVYDNRNDADVSRLWAALPCLPY